MVALSGTLLVVYLIMRPCSIWSRWGGCHVEACWDLWVGAVWGRWICWWLVVLRCEMLPVVSPICPLPLQSIHPPPLLAVCCFLLCWDGSNQYSIWTAGCKPVLILKAGWKSSFGVILVSAVSEFCIASHSLLPISMETKQDPGIVADGFEGHAAC